MITVMQGIFNVKLKSRGQGGKRGTNFGTKPKKPEAPRVAVQNSKQMAANRYTRVEAWTLLNQYTQSASLLKHALGVEAFLTAYAGLHAQRSNLSADETAALVDRYAATALLHDFDYEKYPTPE